MKPPKTISIVCLMAKEIGLQCFNHLLSLNNKWNLNIIGMKTNDQIDFFDFHSHAQVRKKNEVFIIYTPL